MKTFTINDLLNLEAPSTPLWEGLLPATGLAVLAGGSDTGKSSMLRQLAIAVCNGDSKLLGNQLNTRHNGAIVISTEDDKFALRTGVMMQLSKLKNPSNSPIFITLDEDLDKSYQDLHLMLLNNPVDLIIIDSLSDLVPGDLNNQSQVRKFLEMFKRVADRFDCLVLFMHHLGKANEQRMDKSALNGSQAIEAKARAVIILGKEDGYHTNKRKMQLVKGNAFSSSDKNKVYSLIFDEATLTFELDVVKTRKKPPLPSLKKTEDPDLIKKIQDLRDQGLSHQKIADTLNKQGVSIGKTSVGEVLRQQ